MEHSMSVACFITLVLLDSSLAAGQTADTLTLVDGSVLIAVISDVDSSVVFFSEGHPIGLKGVSTITTSNDAIVAAIVSYYPTASETRTGRSVSVSLTDVHIAQRVRNPPRAISALWFQINALIDRYEDAELQLSFRLTAVPGVLWQAGFSSSFSTGSDPKSANQFSLGVGSLWELEPVSIIPVVSVGHRTIREDVTMESSSAVISVSLSFRFGVAHDRLFASLGGRYYPVRVRDSDDAFSLGIGIVIPIDMGDSP